MTPPTPRVNTFLSVKDISCVEIDKISQVYIKAQFLVGMNRMHVLGSAKNLFTLPITGVFTSLYLFLFYYTFTNFSEILFQLVVALVFIEYTFCSILCYILHKKLTNFYLELNKFDKETGFRKSGAMNKKYYIINFIQLSIIICLVVVQSVQNIYQSFFVVCLWILTKTIHCLEFYFTAHLFLLVIPRLKFINRLIKMDIAYHKIYNKDKENPGGKDSKKKNAGVDMKKLMDLYIRIITAFEYLNEAIRWQILTLIMTTFSIILCLTFTMAKTIISDDVTMGYLLNNTTLCIVEIGPFLAPCIYAEGICSEVRRLKEYLTTRIFENTLDKSNRSAARAFLMLIEKRDLSFSIFDMFLIDISLPCKFTALWLTYLVMILQFDKVVNSVR